MILGVTGGIACGKSIVARLFGELGASVVSADELAREAVLPGTEALHALVERFGEKVLLPDGTLDRKALGDLIFADPGARADLNRITHPAIAAIAEGRLAELRRRGTALVVYEAPLLFEAGAEGRVDAVLVVRIDEALQLRRLMEREGLGEEEARRRVAAQMSQDEKVARADYVIDNSGSLESTKSEVEKIFALLAPPPGREESSG